MKLFRSNAVYCVVCELLFLGMVFLLGWLRSRDPNIQSFEMFMDEGFIAAIMRSSHLPPHDMWYAGYSINYYYYAHFVVAMLAKLLKQSPSIAFNTGISIYFGLTAVNLFGVTSNVVAWAKHLRRQKKQEPALTAEQVDQTHVSLLAAIPYGFMTMIMGLILGNLAATQQWWQNHGEVSSAAYDWFAPSRVIDKTINEFPAFSFLLSCFHAHVLTIAFTILAIGLAFNLLLEPKGVGLAVFGRGWTCVVTLLMTALILGGLFTMNGWDLPTYMALTLACISLQHWLAYQKRLSLALLGHLCLVSVTLIWLALFLFIPFYINFNSPAQGFGIVGAQDRSALTNEYLIYGLFLFIFISLLLTSAVKTPLFALQRFRISPEMILLLLFSLLLFIDIAILFFVQNSITIVVMGTIALIAGILLWYHSEDRGHAFTLLLGALAFALIAGCEIFFLKDVFADQYPRMNTVFKFYFQAWALLSIASGAGLYLIIEQLGSSQVSSLRLSWLVKAGKTLWVMLLLTLILASAIYPIYAPPARVAQFNFQTSGNSLDGLTYLKYCRPPQFNCPVDVTGDYAAIGWLNIHVQGSPVIVEAVGDDYSLYARISVFTGLATIMGWQGHEYQWRVGQLKDGKMQTDFNQRVTDVALIYNSPDPKQVLATMAHYHAQYLYVGALEYSKYGNANLQRFAAFMKTVYNAEGVTIYQVRHTE